MALSTPGPVPEGGLPFTAPTGAAIESVAQSGGEDVWTIYGTDDFATDPQAAGWFDYSGDGPDSPDWDTIEIDGNAVFIDEKSERWLARHLVPAGAILPEDAVLMAKRDFRAAIAARMTAAALDDLSKCEQLAPGPRTKGSPIGDLVGTARLIADGAALQAEQLKREWGRERERCAVTLLDGYFWSLHDHSCASAHGWELSQFSDGQVCIVVDEDAAEPAFEGPQANMTAHKHVATVASGELPHPPPEYVALCRRALKIVNDSLAERLRAEKEEEAHG